MMGPAVGVVVASQSSGPVDSGDGLLLYNSSFIQTTAALSSAAVESRIVPADCRLSSLEPPPPVNIHREYGADGANPALPAPAATAAQAPAPAPTAAAGGGENHYMALQGVGGRPEAGGPASSSSSAGAQPPPLPPAPPPRTSSQGLHHLAYQKLRMLNGGVADCGTDQHHQGASQGAPGSRPNGAPPNGSNPQPPGSPYAIRPSDYMLKPQDVSSQGNREGPREASAGGRGHNPNGNLGYNGGLPPPHGRGRSRGPVENNNHPPHHPAHHQPPSSQAGYERPHMGGPGGPGGRAQPPQQQQQQQQLSQNSQNLHQQQQRQQQQQQRDRKSVV